jgi:hypothetical protein
MAIEVRGGMIAGYFALVTGGFALAAGLILFTDGYTAMQQIEALGPIGQVGAQEQYNQATDDFTIGLLSTVLGFLVALIGLVQVVAEDIKKTLEDLS